MKKILLLLLISVLLITVGCAMERTKKDMIEMYSNDENYITLTGEVIKIDKMIVTIKYEESEEYIVSEDGIYNYLVLAKSVSKIINEIKAGEVVEYLNYIDLNVGDIIEYYPTAKKSKTYYRGLLSYLFMVQQVLSI